MSLQTLRLQDQSVLTFNLYLALEDLQREGRIAFLSVSFYNHFPFLFRKFATRPGIKLARKLFLEKLLLLFVQKKNESKMPAT